jgi:hypothetical protein
MASDNIPPIDAGAATRTCTAFAGVREIASGPIAVVALAVRRAVDGGEQETILVFDDATSEPVELDLRGSLADVEARLAAIPGPQEDPAQRGPGRPRLGVVAKEVTLLPRHWEWLAGQPGGASVTLRKLVEDARRANAAADAKRQARDATYRFATAMAGNEPGYEEAIRALFAGDAGRFEAHSRLWQPDIRAHALELALAAFGE